MIILNEAKATKLPGDISIYLEASYNQTIIDLIKTFETSHWDKKLQVWELPITCISTLIDHLCYIDDIEINLLPEKEKEHSFKITQTYKTSPFQYQLDGIEYGLNHDKWLLLDAPGLGKSLQIIYLAQELKEQNNLKHCLIICGVNTLKSNWANEIKKHSNLTSVIIGNKINSKGNVVTTSIKDRVEQLKQPINEFFIIINIESLRYDEIVEALKKGPNKFDMIAVDEIHTCKSPKSLQGKNLLELQSHYMVAMTGTLIMNNPLDAFMPLTWIGANNSGITRFKEYFCLLGGASDYQVIGFKNLDYLKDLISRYSLRRQKDLLNLPTKNIINELVDMNDQHKKFYEDVKHGVKDDIDKVNLKTKNLLSLITRLRQATACPSILTSQNIKSSKLERAKDLVEQIISQGDKVVIFSTFKESVYQLAEELKEYDPLVATGDIKNQDIDNVVNEFQTNKNKNVLLATWQKMGVGITLTEASYAIFIDTPWTNAIYTQAQDRIYRIGTNKPVFIYNLICINTIDERVLEIVTNKEAISDFIIDDKLTETSIEKLRKYIEDL